MPGLIKKHIPFSQCQSCIRMPVGARGRYCSTPDLLERGTTLGSGLKINPAL